MNLSRLLALGVLALGASSTAVAQLDPNTYRGNRTITTAVPFLSICPESRAGGMGEVGVATADDANAMHWNASSLAFIKGQAGASLSYSPWLASLNIPDINLVYLSGYMNTGDAGVIGGSLRYFSLGEIQFTDQYGNPTTTGNPNELAVDVGYGLKISENFSAGVALRYFNSNLSTSGYGSSRAVNSGAGDVGFTYRKDFSIRRPYGKMPVDFMAGVNISNIGPKVSYTTNQAERYFIPTNLRLGYAFKFQVDDYNSFTIINEYNKLLVPSPDSTGAGKSKSLIEGMFGSFTDAQDGFKEELSEFTAQLGAEYWYRELFAARMGFFYEDPAKGGRTFINLGAGIKYNVIGLNFAYLAPLTQNHPLQNTVRFTLTYDFDPEGSR